MRLIRHWRHRLWQRWLAWLGCGDDRGAAFRLTLISLHLLAAVPGMAFWSRHCIGQLYAGVGDPRQALHYYDRALASGGKRDPTIHHHRGSALGALGRFAEAEAELRQAIACKPWAWWSYKYLGELMLRQRRWQDAQALFEKTLQLNNTEHWSYFHLFEARRVTLGWKPALTLWLDEVLAAPPMQGLSMRLGTLWAEGDEISAEQVEKLKLVAQRYQNFEEVNYILGYTLARQGHVEEASRRLAQHMRRMWERDYAFRTLSPAPVKKPEFIIFGNTKCGSTALYSYLVDHPLICPSLVKELRYWDKYYGYGLDWYRSSFMPIPASAPHITGEGSITILWHADAPRRVAQFRSDMKLLLITRDPVARAYSDYQMHRRLGYEMCEWELLVEQVLDRHARCPIEPADLSTLPEDENVLMHSAVLPYLKRWRECFPARQFLVINNEDLSADVQGTVSAAYAFLGVPPHLLSTTERANVGSYPRMDRELEQRLRQWYQPHQDALSDYLATGMA